MVDLQFMKLPLSGDFSVFKLLFGMACAMAAISTVFASTPLAGPALATSLEASRGGVDLQPLVAALKPAALVTIGWNVLYYNLLGSQVWTLAVVRIFEFAQPEDVDEAYHRVAARWAANTLEQAPVFLSSLWLYALFADSASAGTLGALYVASRAFYPLVWCWIGRFTFGFEPVTQTGYGVVGVFWLGTYMASLDQGWLWWVTSVGAVPAALTGFAVGSLALFPGLPAAPFYTFAHFKCHTTKHKSKSA